MSNWRKHFKPVNTILPTQKKSGGGYSHMADKFSSWLPEVYMGPPDRLQRYAQYEQMNMDHDVSAALDTIAEFCTQQDLTTKTPFRFEFTTEPSNSELSVLNRALKQWCSINDFNRRMFRLFRSTLMYGDQFMIRDPQTFKLYWVDPNFVEKVIVNESKGKKIETYFIKELDLNHQSLVASAMTSASKKGGFPQKSDTFPNGRLANMAAAAQGATSSYYTASSGQSPTAVAMPVEAEYVIHASLSEGMDSAWPFGISELENVFKIFKQKSMLEDAMLIYRIHRAPERRIFYVDVGDMPPIQSQQYLEQVKYQIQQKRIPNVNGGGQNVTDSAYNPLSSLEDYFFAVSSDGRGSKVETLPGGDNLGEINDMLYFNNKMFRALGIPSSYLPTGPEDGSAAPSGGKVGVAFIQEHRFNERCKRHQRQIAPTFDREFKIFLKERGITIDNGMFNLEFTEPQNFNDYRQIEMDAARVNVFQAVSQIPYVSKQYALKRYMGWNELEMQENERLWKLENPVKAPAGGDATGGGMVGGDMGGEVGLGDVGMSGADFETEDMGEGDMGGEGGGFGEASAEDIDSFGE